MSNIVACLVVIVLVSVILRARRQPLWAEAYRRLGKNKLALSAITIISLYGLIAFMDSISWKDAPTAPPRTLVDRFFERPKERYYSAPFATETTGEPKPHKLLAKHLLGTDGTGNDVFYLTLKGCRTAFIIGFQTAIEAVDLYEDLFQRLEILHRVES